MEPLLFHGGSEVLGQPLWRNYLTGDDYYVRRVR